MFLPWQISLTGSHNSLQDCTASPVICTLNLWVLFFFQLLTSIIHHHPSHSDLHSSIINHPCLSWLFFKPWYHYVWCVCPSSQEQHFFPSKNLIGKRKCHTYGILTPEDKENAQRLGVSIHVINITYGHCYSLHLIRDIFCIVLEIEMKLSCTLPPSYLSNSFMCSENNWQRWSWSCWGPGVTPCHNCTGACLRIRIKISTTTAPARHWRSVIWCMSWGMEWQKWLRR